MPTLLGIAFAVLVILWLVPIRSAILIEGKFHHHEIDWNLSSWKERKLLAFYFDSCCRSCLERWRQTGEKPDRFSQYCVIGVPYSALGPSVSNLEPGLSYRIIVWKTIFGTVRAYHFELSDFLWVNPHDEEERLEARANGFGEDVDAYRKMRTKQWHESFWQELMEKHSLTRTEAEMIEPLPKFMVSLVREAKRRGIDYDEVKTELDELLIKPRRPMPGICAEYNFSQEQELINQLATGQRALTEEIIAHLNQCSHCNHNLATRLAKVTNRSEEVVRQELKLRPHDELFAEEVRALRGITVDEYRQRIKTGFTLRYGGEDCFTIKERITYATTGSLPEERLAHRKDCIGCDRMIEDDRREMQSKGKIDTGMPLVADSK